MRILLVLSLAASLLCGCVTTEVGGNGPIVSPTHISTDGKDDDAPPFHGEIPWWVDADKEESE